MKTKFLCSMLLLASSMMVGSAYALTACGTSGELSLEDVTFRSLSADDCYGAIYEPNNLSDEDILPYFNDNNVFGADDWIAHLKSELSKTGGGTLGSTSFMGINWSLTANGFNTGVWTLTLVDPGSPSIPVSVDLAIVLKAGNGWASYFFDDQAFNAVGPYEGEYTIAFNFNHEGIAPDLSHLDVLLREGDGGGPPIEVPEPAVTALMGIGLLSLVFAYPRKVRA